MKLVDAQISKMRRLIQVTGDDDPQKPDFLFRLGELYAEKQRFNFNQARALDQKIFELPPNQRGPLQAQQKTLRGARSRSGCSRRSRPTSAPPSSGSTSAWTRCSSASPSC